MWRGRRTVVVVRTRAAARVGLLVGVALLAAWLGGRALAALHLAAAVSSLRGRVVALDPGHGGIDPGAIGPYGVNEDVIVLAVSLDLARMLERAGAAVVLTRQANTDLAGAEAAPPSARKRVDLRARMVRINASGADVLLSIHANHFHASSEHGAQVFYSARRAGESKLLAGLLQTQLAAITGETRRRISEHIDHFLLEHADMPAVTVEIGFLSNPREARLLESADYQQRLAYAMFVALAHWFAQRHAPVASVTPAADGSG